MHLTTVHLTTVHLTTVHLTTVHLTTVHLTTVHRKTYIFALNIMLKSSCSIFRIRQHFHWILFIDLHKSIL